MTTYLPPRAQLSAGLLVASRQWQRLADQGRPIVEGEPANLSIPGVYR